MMFNYKVRNHKIRKIFPLLSSISLFKLSLDNLSVRVASQKDSTTSKKSSLFVKEECFEFETGNLEQI